MNDNDIIKAIEYCTDKDAPCEGCAKFDRILCKTDLLRSALDLINRQKAEIDALKFINNNYDVDNEAIRSAAIKEFAERLKGNCISVDTGDRSYKIITTIWIDDLVKEMTEGEDDS